MTDADRLDLGTESFDRAMIIVCTPDESAENLPTAGFAVERVENRAAATADPGALRRRLGPGALFDPGFAVRLENNVAATRAGVVAPVMITARAG